MSYFVGMDVGGTHIVCGLLDGNGHLLRTVKADTQAAGGREFILDRMTQLIGRLFAEHGVNREKLQAVGIGIPGFIDPPAGVVKLAANLPFTDTPVADALRERLGVPVYIHNDVKMIVYGEAMQGAGRGYGHVLGITLGTGLAAGFVMRGKLLDGGGHLAGEIGHVRLEDIPYVCGCGMRGCLETVASARGIVRQAADALDQGHASLLSEWFPEANRTALSAKDVTKAYDAGDPLAMKVMRHTGEMLGKALAFAMVLYSPDIIVVGGGVSLAGERLLGPLRRSLQDRVHPIYRERIRVVTAQLPDHAGIIGSAEYARMRMGEDGLDKE